MNVSEGERILNSVKLVQVEQDSVDPYLNSSDGSNDGGNSEFGYLMAWGRNSSNQFGNNDNAASFAPVAVSDKEIWFDVSAGSTHAAGIDKDGNLFLWGLNQYGELGSGDNNFKVVPNKVNLPVKWKKVSCGKSHTIALTQSGEIYTWGRNLYGQLGIGNTRNVNSPQRVGTRNDWVFVLASEDQTYALDSKGKLHSWGANSFGQLGLGNTTNTLVPRPVSPNVTWKSISSGQFHALGVTVSGELYSWGRNNNGQLGNGAVTSSTVNTRIPVKISNVMNWRDVRCGSNFSMATNESGELFSWGQNNHGQLGLGNQVQQMVPTKVNLSSVKSTSAGFFHAFAILNNGDVYGWGRNQDGQLGVGSNQPQFLATPTINQALSKKTLSIYCGDYFNISINLKEGGVVIPPVGNIQFQTLMFSPMNDKMSISWSGTTLNGRKVRLVLKRKSDGLVLMDKTYPHDVARTEEFLVSWGEFREYLLDAYLLDSDEKVVQHYKTKFAIRGF